MDYKDVSSLIIEGQLHHRETLSGIASSGLQRPGTGSWEKHVYQFLIDWLDNKDHIIVKTSGSTGNPKRIKIKKQNMVNSAINTGRFLSLKPGDSALLCLPAEYIAGRMMLLRAMVLGLDLTISEPASNPLTDLNNDFDFSAMVPLQVNKILDAHDGYLKLNRVKNLIIGGAPVSAALRKKIKRLTNRSFSTYGMTETITHIAMEPLTGPHADGWLKTLPDVRIKTDAEGRLIIHAPDIAPEPIRTNDLAEIKDGERFWIIGRYDNVIISGGIKIIPETVENKIRNLISRRFIISSQPDEKLGEMPVLVVEGNQPGRGGQNDLLVRVAEKLEKYTRPRKVIFLPKFPEAGNHKINRRKIREILAG